MVIRGLRQTQGLALMMVEGKAHAGHIGKIRRDVALCYLDESILHVLRMDELDLIQDPELFQQGSTDQPVEIAPGYQAALLGRVRCHRRSTPLGWWSTHRHRQPGGNP